MTPPGVILVIFVTIAGTGCAARSDVASHELERLRTRVVALEAARQRDSQRIEDLSTRLVAFESRPVKSRPELPVVRVRATNAREESVDVDAEDLAEVEPEVEPEDDGPRPVLKLYESRMPVAVVGAQLGSSPRRSRSIDLASVNERLPVVPIPTLPGTPPLDTTPASLEIGGGEEEAELPEAVPSVEEVVSNARSQVRGGDCGAVLRSLAQVIAQSPEHPLAPEAMLLRARCHRRQGAPLRAIGELERLARRYPNAGGRVTALLEMAEAYASLGDADRARQIFREIMRRYPRSQAASRATARVQELGRGGRAREE